MNILLSRMEPDCIEFLKSSDYPGTWENAARIVWQRRMAAEGFSRTLRVGLVDIREAARRGLRGDI